MEVVLSPERVGNIEDQRLFIIPEKLRLAGQRFVKRVHQIMDGRIVHIYAQHLRHLAGSFALGSGACH